MKKLHDVVSKRQWFILFNVLGVIMLVVTGRLGLSPKSLITGLVALLLMNGIAAISARKYPEWK